MVISCYSESNFFRFLLMEMLMTSLVSFLGFGLLIFYFLMNLESKAGNESLTSLLNNPALFALVIIIPVAVLNLIMIHKRKRNYIVGFFFENELGILKLKYRILNSNKCTEIEIPFEEICADSFYDKKFFFNQAYKGVRIKKDNLDLDFVSNNFIWEEDIRAKKYFLTRIKELID